MPVGDNRCPAGVADAACYHPAFLAYLCCRSFQALVIFLQCLCGVEIDAVLALVGAAFLFVKLKFYTYFILKIYFIAIKKYKKYTFFNRSL